MWLRKNKKNRLMNQRSKLVIRDSMSSHISSSLTHHMFSLSKLTVVVSIKIGLMKLLRNKTKRKHVLKTLLNFTCAWNITEKSSMSFNVFQAVQEKEGPSCRLVSCVKCMVQIKCGLNLEKKLLMQFMKLGKKEEQETNHSEKSTIQISSHLVINAVIIWEKWPRKLLAQRMLPLKSTTNHKLISLWKWNKKIEKCFCFFN